MIPTLNGVCKLCIMISKGPNYLFIGFGFIDLSCERKSNQMVYSKVFRKGISMWNV